MSKLVVIVGETASGKSSLAHKVALERKGEIICADSRTVYKGMDIGTAKPSPSDREQAQYFGLDLVEPNVGYTVADFQEYAYSKIDEISSRNHIPILVGGTGLFVDSILFDYQFGQKPDPAKRAELQGKSLEELQDLAQNIDENIDWNSLSNKRHLIRIIETEKIVNDPRNLRKDTIVVGISLSKSELRKRIEQRTEVMFRQGLRKEVDDLVKKYGWDSQALTGIGYREFKPYYEGEVSMTKVKNDIVKNTLKYAKRQRTWFKRNTQIEWFESQEDACEALKSFIDQ